MRKKYFYKFWRTNFVENYWTRVGANKVYYPHCEFEVTRDLDTWRTHETNELGDRDIFTQMDRVKIVQKLLNLAFKMDELTNDEKITEYFPVHD